MPPKRNKDKDKEKPREPDTVDLEGSPVRSATPSPLVNPSQIPNDLERLITSINKEDYVDNLYDAILEKLESLNDFANHNIDRGLQFGKKLRNILVNDHIEGFLELIRELSVKVLERDSLIYELKNSLAQDDIAIIRAKIYTLERDNLKLKAEIEMGNEIRQAMNNFALVMQGIKDDLLKATVLEEGGQVLSKVENNIINSNKTVLEEIKKTSQTYAQIASLNKNPRSDRTGQTRTNTLKKPEGVVIIKPKTENNNDYDKNAKLIKDILNRDFTNARIVSFLKIRNGGVKIITNGLEEAGCVRETLQRAREDLGESFEIFIPGKRAPQFILYNIPKEVDEGELVRGLLTKNITLADGQNKPKFKVDFKIPARNDNKNHWVLSVDPEKYFEFMDYTLTLKS